MESRQHIHEVLPVALKKNNIYYNRSQYYLEKL